MSHCADCKGLGDRRPVNPERNPFLERFVAEWAERNGFSFTLTHSDQRSTARLNRGAFKEAS